MILKSGQDYQPDQQLITTLQRAYPTIDIHNELRKMDAWCACNPAKRKTERGITRFINLWLSRATPHQSTSTRHRTLQEDLNDTSWAL